MIRKTWMMLLWSGIALLSLSATGCLDGHAIVHRPGWIIPNK